MKSLILLFVFPFSLITIFSAGILAAEGISNPDTSKPEILPTTQVTENPLDELGNFKTSRPVDQEKLSQAAQYFNISDEMNSLTGVQMRTSGSPTISLRGSQSSARILVMQEDIPLNFADGVGFNPLFIATELTDHVDILKGPASSVFGHDAMGGVVNFKTRKLKSLEGFISDGSFGTTEVFAGYGHGFDGNAEKRANKIYFQTSVYQEHSNGDFIYSVPRVNTPTLASRSSNDQEIIRTTLLVGGTSDGEETKFKWKSYHLLARQIGSTPGAINFLYPQAFNNNGHLHSAEGLWALRDGWEVGSVTSFAILQQNYNLSISQTESLRQTLRVKKDFKTFSVEVFDQISDDQFLASYLQGGQQYMVLNELGANLEMPLTEKASGLFSVRTDTSTGDVLPSLGLTGENEDHWKYFIHYSLGYHPPSLTQKYTQTVGYVGNPNLQSEQSSEVDLGFEKVFKESASLKFDGFQRHMGNLIENRGVGGGNLSPQNVGSADSYGFEAQGKYNLAGFDLGENISYLISQNTSLSRAMLFSPQTQFSGFIEKLGDIWGFKIQSTTWSSYYDLDSSTNNLVSLGPWTTVDFFIHYAFNKNLGLQFAVLNIFDQSRELTLNYPEPQRTFKLMLTGSL